MAFEFLKPENNYKAQSGELPTFGRGSNVFQYPTLATTGANDYPSDLMHQPWLHYNMRLQNLLVEVNAGVGAKLEVGGAITAGGTVTAPTFRGSINVQSWKGFDIKHPNKPKHRLRHICLEGPEAGVYVRGRLTGKNVIELPEYWRGLVDADTITVTLTQIKTSQDLIVDGIEWGTRVKVRSGNGTDIDCFYLVHAERKDGEKLIVEYEGESSDDYPGDNSIYSINK